MNTKINSSLLCVALAGTVNAATVIHEFESLTDITEDFLVSKATADTSTADLVFTVASTTVGGEAFTYTFTIGAGTGVADLSIAGNNMGQAGATNNRFDNGDQITFTVSNISNANVTFDGILGVGTNFSGAGLGFNFGGADYTQGAGLDPRFGAAPGSLVANGSTLTFIGSGSGSEDAANLRGVALQFSDAVAVPEPSTTALLGLFSLACVARRRRR